ncbi:MAG: protein kinase [Planctomycetes bacterium]|nr:protein kinase [Planctomycetota bacterium]
MKDDRPSPLSQPIPGYEVLELLGSGGMSSVYKARHKGLDRMVALKVLRREQLDPGLALARLTKEARVLSRLDHPAIVRSIDFGEAGELVYFVMELVEGKSCKQVLIDRGPFPLREVLLIGERVASALGHAARHGVVHRDVKPGNILLAKDGAVKLTDFGLARATRDRSLTQDGITVGTPQYMSPEQVRSPRRVDLRSDLYSLGATLYHLSTGHPPLRGESVGEILHEVLYAVPRPPEQLQPGLPSSFSRMLARLLAKDVRRRYASAEELIADIARVRASLAEPEQGDSVGLSWQEAAEPPPRANRGLWIAGAGVAVALLAALFLWRGESGGDVDWSDARQREAALLAELSADWRGGARGAAEVLARLGELKRDGQLTSVTSLERVDLKSAASAALEEELRGAAPLATAAARTALRRGDFAAARAALDAELVRAFEAAAPQVERARLATAEVEIAPWLQAARAAAHAQHDELEQELRRKVRQELLARRAALDEEVQGLLEGDRFVAVQERLAAYPAEEERACASATAAVLRAAGVEVAPDVAAEEWRRGWPESTRAEFARDPTASFVSILADALASRVGRVGRDLLFETERATQQLLAEAREGRSIDVAARRAEFFAERAAARDALAAIGALPAALDDGWVRLERDLAAFAAQAQQEREATARAQLLDGAGGQPGLVALLCDRQLEAARAAVAAQPDLPAAERAAWEAQLADLAAVFARAQLTLFAAAGNVVDVRDRQGIGLRGKLQVEAGSDQFAIGSRRGLLVTDLALASLEEAITTAVADPERRPALRFLLGDAKERAAQGLELDRSAGTPVADALRRALQDQQQGAAARREQREGAANERRAQFEAALAAQDVEAARVALRELLRFGDTPAGRAAQADRSRYEAELRALELASQRLALLANVARNASERTVAADGSVRVVYAFDRAVEGEDWNVRGNAVRVENGRLFFVGGASGLTGALYGATLPWPLDRRAPATLTVELLPTLGEPEDPHYVALRVGPACAGFFRPREPKGEQFPPQLAAWVGTLEERPERFFDPNYNQSQPASGRVVAVGLERGRRHLLELRWLPDPGDGTVRVEVVLDGDIVHDATASLATARGKKDAVQLCSLTELQIERVELRGKLLE